MDSTTKKFALLKADKMIDLISYPDFILNNKTKIDQIYESLNIYQDNYLKNLINIKAFQFRTNLQKFGKPVDRKV